LSGRLARRYPDLLRAQLPQDFRMPLGDTEQSLGSAARLVALPRTSMQHRIHGLGDEDAVEPLQECVAVGGQHALTDVVARRTELALDLAQ
jgi:hypothetical protein